jgi:hypothetical protein
MKFDGSSTNPGYNPGYSYVGESIDTGGENLRQAARLWKQANARDRATRRGRGGYFAPGDVNFLLASNRPAGVGPDFQPPPGMGFQLPANQAAMAPEFGIPPPPVMPNPDAPYDPTAAAKAAALRNPLYGRGMGFMMPQNQPLRTGGALPPTKVK